MKKTQLDWPGSIVMAAAVVALTVILCTLVFIVSIFITVALQHAPGISISIGAVWVTLILFFRFRGI